MQVDVYGAAIVPDMHWPMLATWVLGCPPAQQEHIRATNVVYTCPQEGPHDLRSTL